LIDDGLEMDELGAEDLKALLNFFDLVVDFFFDVGSFVDLVAYVNVHLKASNVGKNRVKRGPNKNNCTPARNG
jgi:hypothetical protein